MADPLLAEKTYSLERNRLSYATVADYGRFMKARLASLVVLSAAITYVYASDELSWSGLWLLVIGGFLVTGASNGINQILEKDTDKLMSRTSGRPLPQERMSVTEAWIVAVSAGTAGIVILWTFLNPLAGMLGLIALIMYTMMYTPLKKITPFSVFVGAFPGAIPPLLGWVAATGSFSVEAWIVFTIQFIWQFPHFWAIAWKVHDDYLKGGFKMLPSPGGRDRSSAMQILTYSFALIPVSVLPVFFRMSGITSGLVVMFLGLLFTWQALRLFRSCNEKEASRLMFASFFYLPLVQFILLMDKI